MKRSNIILVGPLPPPEYGQSVSFRMLVNNLGSEWNAKVVNIAIDSVKPGQRTSLAQIVAWFGILFKFSVRCVCGFKKGVVYITIAQSLRGFLRDAVMIWIAVALNKRVVMHLKGGNFGSFLVSQPLILRFFIETTWSKASQIVVLGPSLVGMFDGIPSLAKKVVVVRNGYPADNLPIDVGFAEKNVAALRILYLSNMIQSKGYYKLLDALEMLKSHGVNFLCDFCGEFYTSSDDKILIPPECLNQMFMERVKQLGLEGHVTYHGKVSGDKKWQLLAAADVFVLPTSYQNEGQPVSIIEALASSTAVVSTNFRSIPDLVTNGVEGILIEVPSKELIFDSLKNLSMNPSLLMRMKVNAYKKYEQEFQQKKHLENLSRVFKDALGSRERTLIDQ